MTCVPAAVLAAARCDLIIIMCSTSQRLPLLRLFVKESASCLRTSLYFMFVIACSRLRPLLFLALLPMLLQQTHALNISRTIGDHMVLQRNTPAVIWGFDRPTQRVITTFLGETYTTTAGADGIWRQSLPAMAEGGPYSVQVSSDKGAVNISDILFGDVFVCGGQSNMLFSVPAAFNASAEIKNSDYPLIRLFTVGMGTQSDVPLPDLQTAVGSVVASVRRQRRLDLLQRNMLLLRPLPVRAAGRRRAHWRYQQQLGWFVHAAVGAC